MQQRSPLRVERELRGWSQAKVAEAVGTNVRSISRWEQGLVLPQPFYRERLSTLFEKSPQELGLVTEPLLKLPQTVPIENVSPPVSPLLLDSAIPQIMRNGQQIVGRADLFQAIKLTLVQEDGESALALYGLPGAGKTTLAALLVMDPAIQASFPDGILWAGLGPGANVQKVLTHWATLLGVTVAQGERPTKVEELAQELHLSIGHRQMLLVIDDAWTAEEALALRVGGDRCVHLLTTRLPQVAFAFAHHTNWQVPELDVAAGVELLAQYVPALALERRETIEELVRAVGGLPLALSLLGHYLASQALAGQPRRLQAALQRLREGPQRLQISMAVASNEVSTTTPARSALSLQTAIALSTQQLDLETTRVFRALSIFPAKPSSFSEEAALAVAQCAPETLDALWDTGLLEANGPERYMFHQTIREYAQQQPQDEETAKRFVEYITSYIQTHQHEYPLLEQELPAIEEAFEWANQLHLYRKLLASLHAGMPFFKTRSLYSMIERYVRYGLQAAQRLGDTAEEVLLLNELTDIVFHYGDYSQAKEHAQRGLTLARTLGNERVSALLLKRLGDVTRIEGDIEQAEQFYHEGLQLARQQQDPLAIYALSLGCAKVAQMRGKTAQAQKFFEDAIQIARQHHLLSNLCHALCNMGAMWGELGDINREERYCREALPMAQQLGHRGLINTLLNNLGAIALERGEFAQADRYFLEGLEEARRLNHRVNLCLFLLNQSNSLLEQRKYVQAQQTAREAVAQARQIQHSEYLSASLRTLGCATGYLEGYELAVEYLQESLELARHISGAQLTIAALTAWGEIHLVNHQFKAARERFQEVLQLDKEGWHYASLLAFTYYYLAQVAFQEANIQEAQQYAGESVKLFKQTGFYKAQEVETWAQTLSSKPVN